MTHVQIAVTQVGVCGCKRSNQAWWAEEGRDHFGLMSGLIIEAFIEQVGFKPNLEGSCFKSHMWWEGNSTYTENGYSKMPYGEKHSMHSRQLGSAVEKVLLLESRRLTFLSSNLASDTC